MKKEELEQHIYLKGYKEGFEAAQKIIWAHAEEIFIKADNPAKPFISELINKIKN